MSNLGFAQKYLRLIPQADWCHFINLTTEKDGYIPNIIESDTRPRGQKMAYEAYSQFVETVINHTGPLAKIA